MRARQESRSGPSRLSFRTWTVLLVLAVAVPLLLFGWLTLHWMAQQQADTFAQFQADTAGVLANGVDSELHAWKMALAALAASRSLAAHRLADFYGEAQAVAAQHEGWISLLDPAGHQLLNTWLPYGVPVPPPSATALLHTVLTTQQPAVSDLLFGNTTKRWAVSLAVPVLQNGTVTAAVVLNLPPDRLTGLLKRQQLPSAWTLGIQDSQYRVVTRLPLTEERMGKPTQPWYEAALRTADHGIVTGTSVQGVPVRLAFHHLTEAPWVVTLGIPVAALPSPRPVYGFLALGVLLGCLAVGIALYASRKLTRPVTDLAAHAEQILRGEVPAGRPPSGVREIQALEEALVTATTSVQAVQREQQRAAVAEAQAVAAAEAAAALRAEITQRQQAEAALQASERRERERAGELATILDAVPTPVILVHDAAGTHMTGNRAADDLLRQPRGSEISLSSPPAARPQQLKAVKDGRELRIEELPARRAARGIPVADFEYRLVFDDGTARDLLAFGTPLLDGQGQPRGAVHTLVDITARKQAEATVREQREWLRVTLTSIGDAVLATDDGGRVTFLNPVAEGLTGWQQAEAAGQPVQAVFHIINERTRNPAEDLVARVIREETVVTLANHTALITRDGREVPIEDSAAPIRDPAGHVIGVVIVFHDVTARRKAEAALRQAKAELEQRVQERTAELAEQARQLQALTGELTLAEQRERQRLAHVLHDGLQQFLVAAKLRLTSLPRADPGGIADGCREVTGLLEEALASSRTLTGELSPPALQTGGLLAGLEWLVRWKAEKYQLAVELQADPQAVPDSEAMTLLLFQSVRELLFNVVKHAQVHAARVEVRRQDGHLRLVVSDQGVGFDRATLAAAGGGGLGLASIRQRLEFLGGCVGILTAPGQGCRITLAAPLRSPAPLPPAPAGAPAPAPIGRRFPRHPRPGAKIRLLLVDDHAMIRHALAELLDAEPDLEVVGEAADGKEGVERTKELQPHVVLMDVNMPVLNGMDATQQIRATCPGVQVIGLSMFGAAEQTAAMRQAGAVAYVSKAAPAEELLAAIRACAGPGRAA